MRNEVKLANPNYDSSKIEEFKNVWVFCEQRQGQMMSTSYELISEGRKLAEETSWSLPMTFAVAMPSILASGSVEAPRRKSL